MPTLSKPDASKFDADSDSIATSRSELYTLATNFNLLADEYNAGNLGGIGDAIVKLTAGDRIVLSQPDSAGEYVISATGGITNIAAGTNVAVSQPDSAGEFTISALTDNNNYIGDTSGSSAIIYANQSATTKSLILVAKTSGGATGLYLFNDGSVTLQAGINDLNLNADIDKTINANTFFKLYNGTNTTEGAITPENGMMHYNTDTNSIRAYVNGSWVTVV
ncbi:hypothetical protein [Phage DSL-LC06]|nr:hypothetical protein [Phage DSL-LC06]